MFDVTSNEVTLIEVGCIPPRAAMRKTSENTQHHLAEADRG